ncbi:MAG TPA: hypothetical protein VM939_04285 [Gemmatimonadaceae bacterium]|nr:hypothetical protein [Gemmatimonadaceae bacterium]
MKHTRRLSMLGRVVLVVAVANACSKEGAPPTGPEPDVTCGTTTSIKLSVGEARSLPALLTQCIELQASASYALAFFDATTVERARTGPEVLHREEPGFSMSLEGTNPSAGNLSSFSVRAPLTAFEPHDTDVRLSRADCTGARGNVECREAPWKIGDVFEYPIGAGSAKVTVFGIVGHLVLASVNTDTNFFSDEVKQRYITAAEHSVAHVVPLAKAAFTQSVPVTSDGSKQMLIVIGSQLASLALLRPTTGTMYASIELGLVLASAPRLSIVMGHELTHTWQGLFDAQRGWTGPGNGWPIWATEASADMMAREGLRRAAGIEPASNPDRVALAASDDPWKREYAAALRESGGSISPWFGGGGAMFFREWVYGAVVNDISYDLAMRELGRGSLEGWFGIDDGAKRGTGITARMRAALQSPSWDPVDAILSSVLSMALDERTESRTFQTPVVKDGYKYFSHMEELDLRTRSNEVDTSVPIGALSGYWLIHTGASAGSVKLVGNKPALRLMIARM